MEFKRLLEEKNRLEILKSRDELTQEGLEILSELTQALQLQQTGVSGSLPPQDLIEMLKDCRHMLIMCTLIDKSGQCKELVDEIDEKMGWQ